MLPIWYHPKFRTDALSLLSEQADFQELRNAVSSAVDVMQAIGTSIWTILSKVDEFVISYLCSL